MEPLHLLAYQRHWRPAHYGRQPRCQRVSTFFNLTVYRNQRRELFRRELAERETEDVLDRALLRASHSKDAGVLPAAEFHRISEKVASLKKLRFTEEYERLQDHDTYEWMKYKVAAEVGGSEERAAFQLYEKTKIEEVGEVKYRLFSQKIVDDPVLNGSQLGAGYKDE